MAAPLIEAADCLESGNNTASASWAVSIPAQSTGDLIICCLASDADVTHGTLPGGPNGETANALATGYGGTAQRISVWWWKATGNNASGTVTVTPSASEQWTACVVKVPAGEFDPTTPIGASTTANDTGADNAATTPELVAGATDWGGTVCAWHGIDAVQITAAASGWTIRASEDRGAVGGTFLTRDAYTQGGATIDAADHTIANETDSSCVFIVRGPGPIFNAPRATATAAVPAATLAIAASVAQASPVSASAVLVIPSGKVSQSLAAPTPLAATAAIPVHTVSTGAGATPVTIDQPSPVGATAALVIPSGKVSHSLAAPTPLAATAAVPVHTTTIGEASTPVSLTQDSPIAATAAIPAPAISAGIGLSAGVATAAAAVPEPAKSSAVSLMAAVAQGLAACLVAAISAGAGIAAAPATASAAIPAHAISSSIGLSAGRATATAAIPSHSLAGGISVSASTPVANAAVPAPSLSVGVRLDAAPAFASSGLLIDQNSAYSGGYDTLKDATTGYGQSFYGTGVPLTDAGFRIFKNNSPTGDMWAELYAHTGTFGVDGRPDGGVLATSTVQDIAALSTSPTWVTFQFPTPYTPADGTAYCIVIRYASGVTPNGLAVYRGAAHPGNGTSRVSDNWFYTSWDLTFRLTYTPVPSLTAAATVVAEPATAAAAIPQHSLAGGIVVLAPKPEWVSRTGVVAFCDVGPPKIGVGYTVAAATSVATAATLAPSLNVGVAIDAVPATATANIPQQDASAAGTVNVYPPPAGASGAVGVVTGSVGIGAYATVMTATAAVPVHTVAAISGINISQAEPIAASAAIPGHDVAAQASLTASVATASAAVPVHTVDALAGGAVTINQPAPIGATALVVTTNGQVAIGAYSPAVTAAAAIPVHAVTFPTAIVLTPPVVTATAAVFGGQVDLAAEIDQQASASAAIPIHDISETTGIVVVQPDPIAATADARVPTLTYGMNLSAGIATATAAIPTHYLSGQVVITPPAAQASAEVLTPDVTGRVEVQPGVAVASAAIPAPSISASVLIGAATATATAAIPTPTVGSGWTIEAVPATATAAVLSPGVASGTGLGATTAVASATVPAPSIGSTAVEPPPVAATAAVPSPTTTIPVISAEPARAFARVLTPTEPKTVFYLPSVSVRGAVYTYPY